MGGEIKLTHLVKTANVTCACKPGLYIFDPLATGTWLIPLIVSLGRHATRAK